MSGTTSTDPAGRPLFEQLERRLLLSAVPVWKFIVTGDSRDDGGGSGVNTVILSELATEIIDQGAEFVLLPGDLVNGYNSQAALESQLLTWRNTMQPVYDAGIGVYPVRGNHDLGSPAGVTAWNNVFSGAYSLPANGPAGEGNLTYSVSHENALILGLDEYVTSHRVNQTWLDAELAANTAPHVFAFGHEPAFKVRHSDCLDDYASERDTFWASLADAGGRSYFAGHDHLYDRARIDDGDGDPDDDLHQLIVGTAGAPVNSWSPPYDGNNSGMNPVQEYHAEEYGYVVVEIDDLDVSVTWWERTGVGVYEALDVWSYAAANSAPVATPDAYDVYQNDTLDVAAPGVLANDTDPDSHPLTAVPVTGPTHAAAFTLNPDGSFEYTPLAGYAGPDSFTYKANDGVFDSNVATVTITVNAVNDAPPVVVAPISNIVVDEDAPETAIYMPDVFDDADLPWDSLSYTFTVSTGVFDAVGRVSQANYTHVHQDLLYTHLGDDRGSGPEHDLARDNILTYFQDLGLVTSLDPFSYNSQTYYNVVGVKAGATNPDDIYIVGAHYDSAYNPGADDNASGTAAVMEIARVLSQYEFDNTLAFIAFDREEQGLYGSEAYASAAAQRGDNILGMVNLDMIAYNPAGANENKVLLYDGDGTDQGQIISDLVNAFGLYGGGLSAVDNGWWTDRSDHAPFDAEGFDAALIIEHEWQNNPHYHQSTDAIETQNYIDYAFATDIAGAVTGYLSAAAALADTTSLFSTSFSSADGFLRLSYNADQNGAVEITVRATDSGGLFVEDTFTVTVNPVSDAPAVAQPLDDLVVLYNAADTILDLRPVFTDADIIPNGDYLIWSVAGNTNPGLLTAGISGTDLTLSYLPDQTGTADVTVRATDATGVWVEDTFTVTVVNTAIRGSKWYDADGDAVWDASEPVLGGWTIFLDADQDGELDAGEVSTVTGPDGSYSFTGLLPGDYEVREVQHSGWTQSFPTWGEGPEFQVNTYWEGSQGEPSVATSDSGDFVIAWVSYGGQDGQSGGVFSQRYNADGTPAGNEFQVNTYWQDSQGGQSMAMSDSGEFVIAWYSWTQDGESGGIFAQRYNADGTPAGDEFQVNTYWQSSQTSPSVAISDSGDFVIAWYSDGQDGDGYAVFARRYNSAGTPLGDEFQVNTYWQGDQFEPSVAMTDSGQFVIAWTSDGQDGESKGIFAQRYNADGTPAGGEFQVNTYWQSWQETPSVAIRDSGEFVIVWMSHGQDGQYAGTFAQRYNSDGTAAGDEFQVNTYWLSNQFYPSVAMSDSGEFVITWTSEGQDGTSFGLGIFAQRYNADGTPSGDEFRVNTYWDDNQARPSVAMTGSGQFVIAWESRGQDGDLRGVFAKQSSWGPLPHTVVLAPDQVVEDVDFGNYYVLAELVVDNPSATVTGDWQAATYRPDYYGANYLHDKNEGKGTKSVTFTPTLAQDVMYEVYLWWPVADIWATNVPVDVTHAGGTSTVSVDQSTNGGQWNLIGLYNFTAGTGSVTIRTDGTTSHVAADAVRFLPAEFTVTVDPLVTSDRTPELTGAVNHPAATVQVTVDGSTYAAVNNGDGTWTLADNTISPPLEEGTYSVLVEATDPAANTDTDTGTLTIEADFPIVLTTHAGQIGVAGELESYAVALEAGEFIDLLVMPDGSLQPEVWVAPEPWIDPGPVMQVNTTTAGDQTWAVVSGDAAGNFVVAWASGTQADQNDIHIRRYAPDGTPISGQVKVNTSALRMRDFPRVAMNASGRFVVAWQAWDDEEGFWDIYARAFAPDGMPVTDEFQVNTYSDNTQTRPSVAIADSGRFVVAWGTNEYYGDDFSVIARRYNADGTPAGDEFRLNQDVAGDHRHPEIGMDGQGNFVAAWQGRDRSAELNGIVCQRFNADGSPAGNEFMVTTDTPAEFQSIAVGADGAFAVVWVTGEPYVDSEIRARMFDAQGNPVTGEVAVHDPTVESQIDPAVAVDADGNYTIAWASKYYGLYLRRFDATGTPISDQTEVSPDVPGASFSEPSVYVTPDGDPTVAWTSRWVEDPDDPSFSVHARQLHLTGPGPVTSAGSPGQPIVQRFTPDQAGTYVVWVGGANDTTGDFTVEILRNAVHEQERVNVPNDTLAEAQNIDASFQEVLTDRWRGAARGRATTGNDDWYGAWMTDQGLMDIYVDFDSGAGLTFELYDAGGLKLADSTPGSGDNQQVLESIIVAENGLYYVRIITASDTYYLITIARDTEMIVPVVTVDALATSDTTPTLTGTVDDPAATIEITVAGNTYAATNNGDGTWTLADNTINPPLAEGTYDVAASATNGLGNTGTDTTTNELTIDTTDPVVTVDPLATGDTTPRLTGTVSDATTTVVEVTVAGNTYSAANNGNGTWTLANNMISPALATGTYDMVAVATDAAGNQGTNPTTNELEVLETGIRGSKWGDLDGDGVWDAGEPGLEGWTIFLDADNDRELDAGEISTVTGPDGSYSFTGLAAGEYVVREVQQADSVQTFPAWTDVVPSDEFQVNTYWEGGQFRPSAAMDDSGQFVVAWQSNEQDGDGGGVFAQRYNADGTPLGDEFQVNTHWEGSQGYTSVAMNDSGQFVVAWQGYAPDGEYGGILARRYNADGTPAGDEFQVNTSWENGGWYSSVAMGDSGEFVVAWQSSGRDGDLGGILARRYNWDGTPAGAEFQVNTYWQNYQLRPSAAMSGSGDFVIAWRSKEQDGQHYGVFAQRYNWDGTPAGAEFQVNTYWQNDQWEPSVAMDDSGQFVIAWQSSQQDGTIRSIFAQRYNSAGTPLGDEFKVNTYWEGSQFDPSAAMDDSGRFVVAWTSNEHDSGTGGIFAQRYNPDGTPLGDEFKASMDGGGRASVAMSGSGDFAIAWESYGADGDREGISAGHFPRAPGPHTVVLATGQTVEDINFGNQGISQTPGTPDLVAASDTGVSDTDDLTNLDNSEPSKALQFEVGGTVPGATVTVYADGVAIGSAVAVAGSTTVSTDGAYDLADGPNAITAGQIVPGKLPSSYSPSLNVTIDTSDPVVTVDALATNDPTPQLTGTINEAAAAVEVTVAGNTYSAANNGDGTWTLADDTIWPALTDGTYDLQVTVTDPAGNAASDGTLDELTVDTVAPVVTVDPLTTMDWMPELTGTVNDATAAVEVTVGGNTYSAANNGDGTWTLADNTISPPLAVGTYDVAAVATDPAGNSASDATTDELEIVVATEVIVDNASATASGDWTPATWRPDYYDADYLHDQNEGKGSKSVTFTPTLALQGRYEVYLWWPVADLWATNVPVDVTHNGGTNTVSVDESTNGGQWNLIGTYSFSGGTGGVTIRTDGTTLHVVADAVRFLGVGEVLPTVTVDPLTTTDSTPELTGTVDDPAATVEVTVDGNTYAAFNNGDGTWTLADNTISPALADGTYDVLASATDGLGNIGTDATTNELTIDTTGPVVTVDPLATTDTTPELTGTVDDPAAAVEVTVAGNTYAAANNGDGTWTLADDTIAPALAEGTYDVVASATDGLGNVGTDSTTNELTIDMTAPVVTVDSLATADATPQLTGTVDDATATVEVTVAGNTYSATNNGDGTWTLANGAISPPLALGTHDVAAEATDQAGNSGSDATTDELEIVEPVTEMIVDNEDPGASPVGSWSFSAFRPNYYGASYAHDGNVDKGAKSFTFTPTVTAPGEYEVCMWWPVWSTAATNVPVYVTHSGGTSLVTTDQSVNGGQWNVLGVYDFDAGTAGNVRIETAGTTSHVAADAVRFVRVPEGTVIIDNAAATVTGNWAATSFRPNYYGTDYLHDQNADKGAKSVTFEPTPALEGQYEVYLWWPVWATAANNVPVDVTDDGGTSTVIVDQSINGGQWNLVGTYNFTGGISSVTIRTDGTTSHVAADAVRFLRMGDIVAVTVDPLTTTDTTPELTGTVSYSAATVQVTVDGNTYAATNNGNGTWTLADDMISPALAIGIYDVVAEADAGGGPVSDGTTNELEIVAPVVDVIVDNASATVAGDWLAGTYRPDYYDADYLHDKNANKGAKSVTFTPALGQDGQYEVYLWWPEADVWATNVPVDVLHDGGTSTVSVDQSTNGGQWNLAGTYDFTAGTGSVTIRTDGTTSHVAADAVRFVRVGDIGVLTVTVNPLTTGDATPELTGTVSDPAATVQVTVDGNTYSATNNGDGTWTLADDTISPALALGTYDVAAEADAGGGPVSDGTTDELEIVVATPGVIVDNASATVSGDWLPGTYRPNYYGADYLHDKNSGKGSKSVTFTPSLTEDGRYEVYLWWPRASIWATNVPVDVVHNGGTSTVGVNESTNGGQWNLVGTYNFTAGTGSATIRTDGTTSHVAADAVRFLRIGDISVGDVIVDNALATVTGNWLPGTYRPNYYNANYLHDSNSDKGSKSVTFTPSLIQDGRYEVYMWWPEADIWATNVPVDVTHNTGTSTVSVDESINGGQWNLVGTYNFTAGTGSLMIRTDGTTSHVAADAVRFMRVGDIVGLTVTVDPLTTTDTTPELTGTVSEPAATVQVTVDGNTYSATNNGDGTWTLADDTISPALAIGTYDVVVTADTGGAPVSDGTVNELEIVAPVVEVIVDNTSAMVTGDWMPGTYRPDYYGADYLHDKNSDKGSKTVTFTPTLPQDGQYEVYMWWPDTDIWDSDVPVDITHDGGTSTVMVDESTNGGQWNLIGTYDFTAGTGSVTIRTEGTTLHVAVDAVRFLRVGDI